MNWLDKILSGDVLALAIPIVAILVGGIIAVTSMILRHKERIAMIEQGMMPGEKDDR